MEKFLNLTEQGVHKVEKFFHIENLADPENLEIQHNITLALRAHNLMHKDPVSYTHLLAMVLSS